MLIRAIEGSSCEKPCTSSEPDTSFARLMSSTSLKPPPTGKTKTIWPAFKLTLFPFGKVTRPCPSSTMTLNPPLAVAATISVVPNRAADAPPDLMVPPPAPLGE